MQNAPNTETDWEKIDIKYRKFSAAIRSSGGIERGAAVPYVWYVLERNLCATGTPNGRGMGGGGRCEGT